ncbi:SUMF1/EgtB/PvdO family nonheme iron enzyme [Streptomyces mirabilis]|uniref:SUMF1/EgtB/PvdO family nonheme iron enzyme n=1 Tax=Streptomyces mirabilis TaxID=68239 RepID=UPI0037246ADE
MQLISSHPSAGNERERRGILLLAGLDDELIAQVDFSGAPLTYVARLLHTLREHGALSDGRDAQEAFLTTCLQLFGEDGRAEIEELIRLGRESRMGRARHTHSLNTYLGTLIERWSAITSPLLPEDCELSDVAVPLRVVGTGRRGPDGQGSRSDTERVGGNLIGSPVELSHLMADAPEVERWLVLGDPGMGKTVMCIREAARLAEMARADPALPLPVLVSLSLLGQRVATNVDYSVYDFFDSIGATFQVQDLGNELRRAARRGKVVVFLDGADEVPETVRERVFELLHFGTFPGAGNRLVVTSRKLGASKFTGYRRVEIAPLTIDDQRKIMLLICGEERTKRLLAEMSARTRVREMAAVPMMLTVLALVAREAPDFSRDYFRRNTDLFRFVVRILLEGRHRSQRSVADPYEAERILAGTSLILHQASAQSDGEETFFDTEVEAAVEAITRGSPAPWPNPRAFIDDVATVSNIIYPLDGLHHQYRYLHRTIREFLAALAIARIPAPDRWQRVSDMLPEQAWGEVLVLLAGLVPEAETYVVSLLNASPDLALRALKEVDSLTPETATQVLQLRPMQLRNRRQVFVELIRKLPAPEHLTDVVWVYASALGERLPRADLFFINDVLTSLHSPLADELADELFDQLPRVPEDLFSLPGDLAAESYWCTVPGGPCVIGGDTDDPERPTWVSPHFRVDIPEFQIGKVPVTNAVYEIFDPAHRAIRNFQSQVAPNELDHHPVVDVSWYEAAAFCMWAQRGTPGVRLPVEMEWEKAASWTGAEKLRFPWGNTWDPQKLNGWQSGPNHTTRVGAYPDGRSPCGAFDMAGNVWEWCLDWFVEDLSEMPFSTIITALGDRRVDRGGGWYDDVGRPCTFLRAADAPGDQFSHCGFRVARSSAASWRGMDLAVDLAASLGASATPGLPAVDAGQTAKPRRRRLDRRRNRR